MSDDSFVDALMRLFGMADQHGFAGASSLADIPTEHLASAGIDLQALSAHELRLLEDVIADQASGAGGATVGESLRAALKESTPFTDGVAANRQGCVA